MLRKSLSSKRFAHSVRVARVAKKLAVKFGESPDLAKLAGLAHDWAREWPVSQILAFLEARTFSLTDDERAKPLLAHGKLAAVLLEETFDFHDEAVLEAVSHHTLGKSGMTALARIVFVADYLEPGRPFRDRQFRASMAHCCLACMVREVILHGQKTYGDLHSLTKGLYDEVAVACTCRPASELETETA